MGSSDGARAVTVLVGGPTAQQLTILESNSRIRVVRAAPGSGKTWLVAEAIRRECRAWNTDASGIAALSFTRVGGEEIRSALRVDLEHPSFVGTLDSFLFRYIVRPHLRAIDPTSKTPELIPPDWGLDRIWLKRTVAKGLNPFMCFWSGRGANGKPVLSVRDRYNNVRELDADDHGAVLKFKQALRKRSGQITVSDSALLASEILRHQTVGPVVAGEIARRFPLIIVDELQDTGLFHGECLRALLTAIAVRALLVGDPDQAIYEFSGARPEMLDDFAKIEGATEYQLEDSLRCPTTVAAVASHVKQSGGSLVARPGDAGSAVMVVLDNFGTEAGRAIELCGRPKAGSLVRTIARSNRTVRELEGKKTTSIPRLHCQPAFLLHLGVYRLSIGEANSALAAARTAIELTLFDAEGLTDAELGARGVDPQALKASAIRCLMRANSLSAHQTVLAWQTEAVACVEVEAVELARRSGLATPTSPKAPQKRVGWDADMVDTLSSATASHTDDLRIQTIHSVKGETHGRTILVIAPSAVEKKCPSMTWWPAGNADHEEQRIAYVALTRSSDEIVVCVDSETFARLEGSRPEFVKCFVVETLAQLEARLAKPSEPVDHPPTST